MVRNYKRKAGGKGLTKKQKKQVKNMVDDDVEVKRLLFEDVSITWDGSGTALARISPILDGTDYNQRVGEQVTLKDMSLRYFVHIGDSAFLNPDAYCTCRMILFRWYGNDAQHVPGINDILDTAANIVDYVFMFIHSQNVTNKLLHIIYDKTVLVESGGVWNGSLIMADAPGSTKQGATNFPLSRLGRKKITYNQPGSADGIGNIYAMFLSNSNATPHPAGSFSARIRYTDA